MPEDILKRLQARNDRRSFLKGSALLAASAFAIPRILSAQEPQQPQSGQPGQNDQKPADEQDKSDQQNTKDKDDKAPAQQAQEGDGAKTFVGSDGRPYRICPQCGANMYKQNRTWTCENCGYSYDE